MKEKDVQRLQNNKNLLKNWSQRVCSESWESCCKSIVKKS